ncbi:pyridoxamine 5'-phosphate oxidase family protein [Streptomyces manipurensis]|uniref:pyridoxamine 5'-phosphate oxidase family protein n=1 Tax=Streptomyces manipurensis TaxID=1077945 RepID=UPI003C700B8B
MSTMGGNGAARSPRESGDRSGGRRTDLGRRLAARRAAAGLSRAELGERCGADAHDIASLEEQAALPAIVTLVRLADELGTTVEDLVGHGSGSNSPPSAEKPDAQLVTLDEHECRRLLGVRGIGRVAFFTPDGPAVHPVNYLVVDTGIAFSTAADTVLARAVGTEAAFETERIDDVAAKGWSILAVGRLDAVTDASALERRAAAAHFAPWAGEDRTHWMKITPVRITGRRVVAR